MFTGWRRDLKFELNRPLTADEKKDALSRDAAQSESYDDRGGLVSLNSTYIEWIDRRFRARGSGTTFLSIIGCAMGVFLILFATYFSLQGDSGPEEALGVFTDVVGIVLGIGIFSLFYWRQISIDFFQRIYWPIRFNRKNRMIYVYRDKRDGGILQVPWDKVYFHVGYGMQTPTFVDIRGEVLDGNTVKDTFALGPYYPGLHVEAVREAWAFICRYMEGGPEAVGPDSRDRYIENSIHGTWRDCVTVVYTNYGAPNALIRVISIPFIAASTLTRWLVFKSCTLPRWPEDIEAACKVEPNDPNVWPQPRYMDQFYLENASIRDRRDQRRAENRKREWDAEPKSELANDMAGLEDSWQDRDKR